MPSDSFTISFYKLSALPHVRLPACGAGRYELMVSAWREPPIAPRSPQVCAMQRRSLRTLLLRRHPNRPGGKERHSNALTLPGQNFCTALEVQGDSGAGDCVCPVDKSIFHHGNDAI